MNPSLPTDKDAVPVSINKSVGVIIANWNGRQFLDTCLASLSAQTYPHVKIFIVDNGSTDDSISFLERNYPHITLIKNDSNLGFARANNIGIEAALQDDSIAYVALLNNDTEVDARWLQELVISMEHKDAIGVVASKITNYTHRTVIDSAGDFISSQSLQIRNRGNGEVDVGQYQESEEVFAASAAASLVRRKTLEDINICNEYFDNDFGNYVEDVDLCVRARLMGWLCWYAPEARAYHIGSATSTKLSSSWKYRLTLRNRVLMAIKDFPLTYSFRMLFFCIVPTAHEVKSIIFMTIPWANRFRRHPEKKPLVTFSFRTMVTIYLGGIFDAMLVVPTIIRKRHKIMSKRKISDSVIRQWFMRFSS
jgi:GT2 family glycosyltransferase